MLLLSMEIRDYDDWPGSVTDPNAPRERAKVVGDIVMEVRPDGSKVERVAHARPASIPTASAMAAAPNYWGVRGYPGTMDWCHANGTCYDARDDSILVSLRTQDCIVKFDRSDRRACAGSSARTATGDEPWSDKLLKPDASVAWQFHQHDCSITPAGTILCFDNGNHRAQPFAQPTPAAQSYSRAVEFAVDEANGTVTPGLELRRRARRAALCRLPGRRDAAAEDRQHLHQLWRHLLDRRQAGERARPLRARRGRAARQARHLRAADRGDAGQGGRARSAHRRRPGDPKALSVFRSEYVPA